jgi:hypothetical protein
MARQGITEEQVFAAAEKLQEEGLAITSTAIRTRVGGTGSYSTINTLLDKWREVNLIPDMPNILNRAAQQLWAIAWKEAQDIVKAEREALAAKRRKIELEHQDMLKQIDQLEDQNIKLEDDNFLAEKTEKMLSSEIEKLYQLVEDAITRVDDIFNELKELNFEIPLSVGNERSLKRDGTIHYIDDYDTLIGSTPSKLWQLKAGNGKTRIEFEKLKYEAKKRQSSSSQTR